MFSLDERIASEIAFAMEDQDDDALINVETGRIASPGLDPDFPEGADDEDPETADAGRWASLPAWSSADGFKLMERFASAQRNEAARTAMGEALSSRRGVFKAFKESLSAFPELEARFFHFKDLEMIRVIGRWYRNLLAEEPPRPGTVPSAGEGGGGVEDLDPFLSDVAACELRETGHDRALRLLDALLPSRGAGLLSEREYRNLLYAECAGRLDRAVKSDKALILEARIPGMEDSPGEADSLALLLGERLQLPGGASGLLVFFLLTFPEYLEAGIDAILLKEARSRSRGPLILCSYAQDLLVEEARS